MRWVFLLLFGTVAIGFAAQDDELPAGKGKEIVQRTCTKCHAASEFTNHKYSKGRWANVVDDMLSRGAEGTEDEVHSIVSYLSRHFGKPVNVNAATAQQLEDGLSLSPELAKAVVLYRSDHGNFKTVEDFAKIPGIDAAFLEEQTKNIVFN